MSQYDIETAIHRLNALGVDTTNLYQDYYKIPLENINLQEIESDPPKKEKINSKHTIIIDSRQRDYSIYPTPDTYIVNLMEPHRYVEKIELIAAMIPKTEYNINSENNLILLTIGGIQEALYMNEGQYSIGSNVVGSQYYTSDGGVPVFGIIAELVNTLNTHSMSSNSFNVFLASISNTASILNRIVITNSSVLFSIDFNCNNYSSGSPFRILGFNKQIYTSTIGVEYYGTDDLGTCLPTSGIYTSTIQAMIGIYDYDVNDDPKYIIMDIEFGNRSAERVESIDYSNQKFAVIIYDANDPDNIDTYNTSVSNTTLGYIRKAGRLKALKGSDFDKKIVTLSPSITLENFKITFTKYNNSPYNFHNREHLLTFEIDVADYDPKYRY
jgi:hypothetical protein